MFFVITIGLMILGIVMAITEAKDARAARKNRK